MDTCIIADCDALAARIASALKRHQLDCPSTRVLEMHRIGSDGGQMSGFAGMIFVAAKQLDARHCDVIRTLRATSDLQARIVAVSSVVDHGTVLTAVRAGACDILPADDGLEDEIELCISRVRSESQQKEARGRVITIVPCHAPADANFLAANLAAVIAARKASCGVLDFHFRGGDMALLLKLQPQHTVLDLIGQGETVDESMFRQALTTHGSGVQLLAGPTTLGDMSSIRVSACQQIISLAQRCWPVVIINSEDIQHAEQIRALAAGDEIILTMRLDIPSLHRTQNHVEFLARNQISRDHMHVVAMGTGHSGELLPAHVKKFLKLASVHCIPDDPVAAIMSINVGNPLVLESPKAKSSLAIVKLADSILGSDQTVVPQINYQSARLVKSAAVLVCNAMTCIRLGAAH